MNPWIAPTWKAASILLVCSLGGATAQEAPSFASVQMQTNGAVELGIHAPPGFLYRVEASADLKTWSGVSTIAGSSKTVSLTTGSKAVDESRFFRAVSNTDPLALTGDHFATEAGELTVHPVNHATFIVRWGDTIVYNDPVGDAALYQGIPKPDLVLVSHSHGDHFNATRLDALQREGTRILAPAVVYSSLSAKLKLITIPIANGQSTNVHGVQIDAIPAYNTNHPKGVGNGYVLGLGGKRVFISGDTGNIPEMRALLDIDIAFVCMNVPFTMTIPDAVTAVRSFRPGTLYPYHYRNQDGSMADLQSLRRQLFDLSQVEVRLRAWY